MQAPPKFIYFDLGMVLVTFSIERMCRQMGAAAGLDEDLVRRILFDGDLESSYEHGRLTTHGFYDEFCRRSGARADYDTLCTAASDIFELNAAMLPIVGGLQQNRWRLGILSNTCECHWKHCLGRYRVLQESFQVYALSYELQAAKPEPAIFAEAARLAGVAPEEIFYTDDMPGHVAAARSAGFDAVVFAGPVEFAAELRQRGVRLSY